MAYVWGVWLFDRELNTTLIQYLFASLDDVFHNLAKEDHRQPPPATPRNGPAGLTALPPLSGPTLPPTPTTHLPTMGSQPFPKMATPAPDFIEAHQGLCLPPAEPPASSADGHISAPPSVCRYDHHHHHHPNLTCSFSGYQFKSNAACLFENMVFMFILIFFSAIPTVKGIVVRPMGRTTSRTMGRRVRMRTAAPSTAPPPPLPPTRKKESTVTAATASSLGMAG